ncbi:MAG: CaiB/BaiF CoA-transferase family protein [Bdellovibrionota bacterium]
MSKLLSGIKVLDLSRLLPGPYCTLLLSDLGADVIKVEDFSGGDYARLSPPLAPDGQSAFYHFLNRGKRSMKLNLKKPEGVELLKRLVKSADILVESFRPNVMDKLGVGYSVLAKENPKLIYCSITGYGWTGPYKEKAGHDNNYLSYAGVLGVTGERDRRPSLAGVQIADIASGALFGTVAILAALHRARTEGKGTFIDTSMTDGSLAILGPHLATFVAEGRVPRTGEMMLSGKICCYTVYETKDGKHMSVGALEPKFWAAFCQAVKRPDLSGAAFTDAKDGQKHYEDLKALFKSKTQAEWIETLKDADCCVEPVLLMDDVMKESLFEARGMWTNVSLASGKSLKLARTPFALDGKNPEGPDTPAPKHGEHTDSVLKEFGLSDSEVTAVKKAGAV